MTFFIFLNNLIVIIITILVTIINVHGNNYKNGDNSTQSNANDNIKSYDDDLGDEFWNNLPKITDLPKLDGIEFVGNHIKYTDESENDSDEKLPNETKKQNLGAIKQNFENCSKGNGKDIGPNFSAKKEKLKRKYDELRKTFSEIETAFIMDLTAAAAKKLKLRRLTVGLSFFLRDFIALFMSNKNCQSKSVYNFGNCYCEFASLAVSNFILFIYKIT